jgi:hypothetical protein
MAFTEFAAQVFTPSSGLVTISNNLDTSIDGSSKKMIFESENESVTLSFTAIDLSDWEEISFHVFLKDQMTDGDIFRFTIDGTNYDFSRDDLRTGKWTHILLNCVEMGTISSIVITSLVADLTLMIDYIGYRRVTYTSAEDVIKALKDHINLDYDYSTTLSADVEAGDEEIALTDTDSEYITDTSVLEIDDGGSVTETVELNSRSGELSAAIVNPFSSGDEVRVLCPVRGEDYDSAEPDPICGIKVYDITPMKEDTIMTAKNGVKLKQYLANLGILIYIDCKSKTKLSQLIMEFNFKYGEEFQFLLDGERVDIYLETSIFADKEKIGNNPRMAYYYRLQPQPYLLVDFGYIDDLTLTVESLGVE